MHYILLSLLLTIAALTPARAADWMARIADTQRVCRLSIPGTHDACTGYGFLPQDTLAGNYIARINAATAHMTGLKIGIMGCIVNGPGEMADADYGYVGAGKGKISLYKQKTCIAKNIPEDEAVERLLKFIEEDRK